MKQFLIFICVLFIGTTISAQNIAIFNFNAGDGISCSDVEVLSNVFREHFTPRGYDVVEYSQIQDAVKQRNLQQDRMSNDEKMNLAQELNASMVVIGNIRVIMGQYDAEIDLIDIKSKEIVAESNNTWGPNTSFRIIMKNASTCIADKISRFRIGDTHEVNGVKGIVFTVSDDGKHGGVIRYIGDFTWYGAIEVCSAWGGSWSLPSRSLLRPMLRDGLARRFDVRGGWFWTDDDNGSSTHADMITSNGNNCDFGHKSVEHHTVLVAYF